MKHTHHQGFNTAGGGNTINPALAIAQEEKRKLNVQLQIEKMKVRQVFSRKRAHSYLDHYHLFEMEEAHYSPNKFTGEQKIMLGAEAKETNRRLAEEFRAHMCDCLDKKIQRTMPMRHWKVIEKNVEPPNPDGEK